MIPSTYIFLSFYSLINLNVINWGTREAATNTTINSTSKETIIEKFFRKFTNIDDNSSFLARLLVRCIGGLSNPNEDASISRLRLLERRLERAEKNFNDLNVLY